MPTPDGLDEFADLRGCSSVVTWLSSMPATPSIHARRLAVLQRFCAEEGSDPDTLIARGNESRDAKIDTMRRLRRWAERETSGERDAHEVETVVRGFFISNGLRVITKPYPDVYRRSPATEVSGPVEGR